MSKSDELTGCGEDGTTALIGADSPKKICGVPGSSVCLYAIQ
jgi:hypothetical protein